MRVHSSHVRLSRCGVLAVLLALLGAAGCDPGVGTLSGQVTYKDKPVTGGWLTFRPADSSKNSVTVEIDEKGNYTATVPAGEVLICVDNRELERQPGEHVQAGFSKLKGTYVPIPEKYYAVETSGLHHKVERGAQAHNIELK